LEWRWHRPSAVSWMPGSSISRPLHCIPGPARFLRKAIRRFITKLGSPSRWRCCVNLTQPGRAVGRLGSSEP
jgi:hypothetical protein